MLFNYHTHTSRCRHAEGEDRDYIEAAIVSGFSVLGFSDHVPYPFLDGHTSGIRMALKETAGYIESLSALKEEYRGKIEIHIGFEAEYDPSGYERLRSFLSDFPCEYLINGQHYLDVEHEIPYVGMPTRREQDLRIYCETVRRGLEHEDFLYLAHPDLINYIGPAKTYEKHMRLLCRTAAECGKPLEINLLGLYSGRNYPTERFFRIAAEEGCRAVIGFDAHNPSFLENMNAYRQGRALAHRCGIEVIDHPLLLPSSWKTYEESKK